MMGSGHLRWVYSARPDATGDSFSDKQSIREVGKRRVNSELLQELDERVWDVVVIEAEDCSRMGNCLVHVGLGAVSYTS